ncbi:hypothetical protein [Paenibacillus sp. 1P07SE]|uniref:hypothetical protein n=1 Tax=Paenibacillus sp. 1P07SE TaxID=3132209 RepID=UPI0039A46936
MTGKKVLVGTVLMLLIAMLPWAVAALSPPNEEPRLYKTLPGTQEDERELALHTHREAIELIAAHYEEEHGERLVTDLDDKAYQGYVKAMGTVFDLFPEEETAKVVEFVKFMDLYENYGKNKERPMPIPENAPSTAEY